MKLQDWKGEVEINGVSGIPSDFVFTDNMVIILHTTTTKTSAVSEASSAEQEYKVVVRQYMTKPSTPSFDFMQKFNHDIPMPLRTMVGVKVKETQGMVYMKLHGDILEEQIDTCMCCGRPITNPVSKYFGMGPECGRHNYVNPFETKEELQAAVNSFRKQLQETRWEGWIIKSAILSMEEIENGRE